ncbi:MAG: hypothetical protein GXO80_10615 [Chlorobi bacterium]|nr:hypothetical protein [Chlorobiota bacterium]
MASLEQKIHAFIDKHFPDIDYSILGANQEKEQHKKALNYEYFVNSIEFYTSQKEINTESIKQISTGDMRGIDGCYLLLNNQFFYLPTKEITDFYADWKESFNESIEKVKHIDAEFIFIQSKSSRTDLDKFKGFCDAVYDTFSNEESDLSANLQVETIKYVFSEISKKNHAINLTLKLCAIHKDSRTLTKLTSNSDWKSAIEKQKKELKSTIFSNVNIEIKSGQDYQEELEAILSPNQRNFPIENLKDRFIEITNEQATCYLGYLNLKELKTLLTSDGGHLDDVFFDNIRYFEGMGTSDSVNSKIYKSLDDNKDIFHLLHNGITITAHSKHFNPQNGNLEIKAFSIINGCQTSNIIWEWIKNEDKSDEFIQKINIPVKLIISSNNDLRAKVTETANSQNEVKTIQLIAVSDEAKNLQVLFSSEIRNTEKLYYERLSNQYPDVGKSFKLLTTDIFRAFYSSFGKSPHKLTVGYGGFEREMLKRKDFLGTKNNGQSKYDIKTYHISAILFNYLERYIRSKYPSLISLRHHFLLLLFISLDNDFIEKCNMYKTKLPEEVYKKALALVKNKKEFEKTAIKICEIAIKNMDFFITNNSGKPKIILKSYYTEEGTLKMINKFKEQYNK